MMAGSLDALLQHPGIWLGDRNARVALDSIPTGFPLLDAQLPGGGWPMGALTEILSSQAGVGELRLGLPALARLSTEDRWLAWIAPPYVPYAPALAANGINLSRVLVVRPASSRDAFWAAEQALRAGCCGAVLFWPQDADERKLRRLQLSAEAGGACGLIYRPARMATAASPAALRLSIEPEKNRLHIRILKRRGGGSRAPLSLDLAAYSNLQ